ncbi:MAG: helix-turn-helix transcriptional regulator [Halobacteriota archaeon]
MNDTEKEEKKTVQKILQVLACSDLRKSLAEALRDGKSLTLSQLSERVGASSPAAVHALRELAKEHLTYQDEKRNYSLTNIGEIVMRKFEEISVGINVLSKHRQFWLEHDLTGIPISLLDKIGCLDEAEVISSTPTELFKIISTYNLLLENAKEVRGITPFFTEDMPEMFIKLVAKGGHIELVVTPEVLDAVLKNVDRSELEKALETNLKFFTIEQPPSLAFTVTDYFMEVGFFRLDGTYDWTKELLCYSEDSLSWGRKLFQYYVKQAELVVL